MKFKHEVNKTVYKKTIYVSAPLTANVYNIPVMQL